MPTLPRLLALAALALVTPRGPAADTPTLAPGVRLVPVGLGQAFANLNSQSFSRHTLYTVGSTQYIAFYAADTTITVGRRALGTDRWELQTTPFRSNNARDGHNVVSLGLSSDGHLHLSWGMHGNPFRYARTRTPGALDLAETPMTGRETHVTYPQFIACRNGDLLYLFRQGGAGSGNSFLNRYSVKTGTWSNVTDPAGQRPFIVGLTGTSNCSAYPNHIGRDARGDLHLTWCWRNQGTGINGNQDTLYARSPDDGLTWFTSTGKRYDLPITRFTADNIFPIATNSTLMNMSGQCLDRAGRPIICNWWAPKGAGTPVQYQVIWNDGRAWRVNQISERTGTGPGPNRPLIVRDRRDRLWVVFTDPERGTVPEVAWTDDPRRARWRTARLTDEFMGHAQTVPWGGWEATHDPVVWERDGKLHLFYQPITGDTNGTRVSVLEFDPEAFLRAQPARP